MSSVQFTWADVWLQWYAEQVNENVKQEFIEQIELKELISKVSPKIQLEILEFAPVEIKYMVRDSIHSKYRNRILWNIDEYIPPIPWKDIFETIFKEQGELHEQSDGTV